MIRNPTLELLREIEAFLEQTGMPPSAFGRATIVDPTCGWGTIVVNAILAGYNAAGCDLVYRGWDNSSLTPSDFLKSEIIWDNIVTNPPFDLLKEFTIQAVRRSQRKAALIFPLARMPAAHWLEI